MADYYDERETQGDRERTDRQFARLRKILAESGRDWGVDPAGIKNRGDLAGLPILRKAAIAERQRSDPPLGSYNTRPVSEIGFLFQSPGRIYEAGGDTQDWWRFARALFAAGMRANDIIHNSFSYHLTPAGKMFESAARKLGATVIAAGTSPVEAQLYAAIDLGATCYAGAPDFLKTLLDRADEMKMDLSAITRAIVSGGALYPSLRQHYADRGVRCLQCYGTAELGLIAYESEAMDGLILDEDVIVELLVPNETEPVEDGEVGEIVVTSLNPDYPMIRLATGDLSALLAGRSPCGRKAARLKGWLGRADQTTKVKAMFVWPGQIDQITGRHEEITRARLIISRREEQDHAVLEVECGTRTEDLAERIEMSAHQTLKLRVEVMLLGPGALPENARTIEDRREFKPL